MDIHTCWLMTDCRREQGCIAVAICWPLSTPCLKMTTLRFSESHSEVFEADRADLTAQTLRQSTTGLYPQISFTTSYISTGLLTSFEPDCEYRLSLDSFADNPPTNMLGRPTRGRRFTLHLSPCETSQGPHRADSQDNGLRHG